MNPRERSAKGSARWAIAIAIAIAASRPLIEPFDSRHGTAWSCGAPARRQSSRGSSFASDASSIERKRLPSDEGEIAASSRWDPARNEKTDVDSYLYGSADREEAEKREQRQQPLHLLPLADLRPLVETAELLLLLLRESYFP